MYECLGLRPPILILVLEAMTMGYFSLNTYLILVINSVLSFKSIYSDGAPVISLNESHECPMFSMSKLPKACAYAFYKIIKLISFPIGFVNIFGNASSTIIFIFFPLSNMFT